MAEARLVRLRIERREIVASGKVFGLAGPYEKLIGIAEFSLDPDQPQNQIIVDLPLAPRNVDGDVEFSAEFYLLKPVDPTRGNGRLFYEVGNRGSKRILRTFQKAPRSSDPMTVEEFGDGSLMREGFSLLWMGWQWDVPEGRMRMTMPIATDGDETITGLVRGNFVGPRTEKLGEVSATATSLTYPPRALAPAQPAPLAIPRAAISSSACMTAQLALPVFLSTRYLRR